MSHEIFWSENKVQELFYLLTTFHCHWTIFKGFRGSGQFCPPPTRIGGSKYPNQNTVKLCSATFKQCFTVCWCHASIVTKQSQANVAFMHLHFELPCFVCVYTSFTFGFYQSCAAVFAESAFFYDGTVLGSSSVSSKPQWGFFHCFLWHLHLLCWGFASLVYLVLPCSVFYIFTLFWIYICF